MRHERVCMKQFLALCLTGLALACAGVSLPVTALALLCASIPDCVVPECVPVLA